MDADIALSAAAVLGLVLLAGCILDVILRPLPVLAPRRQRGRRYVYWTALVGIYLAVLVVL